MTGLEVINQAADTHPDLLVGQYRPEVHDNTLVADLVHEWDPTCDISKLSGIDLSWHERKSREEANARFGQ